MESAITAAPNARKARWAARISQAAPAALLATVLAFFAWLAITLVNLSERVTALETRVTALETGQQQTNARLTRLETRMEEGFQRTNARLDDIYKLLLEDRLPPK